MPIYYMNDYQSTRAGERGPIEVSVDTLELCCWWWSPLSLQRCTAVVNKNKNKKKTLTCWVNLDTLDKWSWGLVTISGDHRHCWGWG